MAGLTTEWLVQPDKQRHSARRSELSNAAPWPFGGQAAGIGRVRILQRATAVTVVKIAKVDATATGVSIRGGQVGMHSSHEPQNATSDSSSTRLVQS